MVLFYDISEWEEARHLNTKGTRNKCVLYHPKEGDLYYFKTSLLREGRDYRTEFWSEIIASEVGQSLGFDVLQYHIAVKDDLIGCLSKNMLSEENQLIEGVNLLTGIDNDYNPEDKASYRRYTFDFVREAFTRLELDKFLPQLIRTAIFDAIIGNSDRHQENWGFIVNIENLDISFSPIYDSGCCLGRECTEEKVEQMLANEAMFSAFIRRGKPEFRISDGSKVPHIEFLQYLQSDFSETITDTIRDLAARYDKERISDIVCHIDDLLPDEWGAKRMTENRKRFIVRIIDTRIKQLFSTF